MIDQQKDDTIRQTETKTRPEKERKEKEVKEKKRTEHKRDTKLKNKTKRAFLRPAGGPRATQTRDPKGGRDEAPKTIIKKKEVKNKTNWNIG